MALRAGYYGIKRFLRDKLETIARTYDETIKSLFPRSEQAVLGAKNLLTPFLISESKTVDNAIFTVNSDGTVDLSTSQVGTGTRSLEKIINLTFAEDVILTGCPENGGLSNYQLDLNAGAYADTGEGILIPANTNLTKIRIRVASTYNNSNAIKFEPMLRFATDPDDTYVPYAMTNKELTDSASDQKTAINAIITAATGAADFAAFKTAMGAITPVTRSLSLAKEDITEEVKEDVEPEKTVTKKRTTKKTEEV